MKLKFSKIIYMDFIHYGNGSNSWPIFHDFSMEIATESGRSQNRWSKFILWPIGYKLMTDWHSSQKFDFWPNIQSQKNYFRSELMVEICASLVSHNVLLSVTNSVANCNGVHIDHNFRSQKAIYFVVIRAHRFSSCRWL